MNPQRMQEPNPADRERAPVEPWWHQDGEPDYLVLPERGRDTPEAWSRELAAVRTELSAFASEVRHGLKVLGEAVASVRADGAEVAGAVGEARQELGGILRDTAGVVQVSIENASRAMGEDHASTIDRYAKELAISVRPLADGLARMDRLASSIEAMGKRRGFQKLVRSEQALRDEQAAMARTLGETGADVAARVTALAERIGQLEERLEEAARDAVSIKQVPANTTERVAGEVERLRAELSSGLQDRFRDEVGTSVDRLRAELEAGLPVKEAVRRLRDLAGTQTDLARVQRSIDNVTSSLRTEVRSLRDRIQSWGKPRTAPRLAREVDEIGGRLDALEEEIREGIAERVAGTVTERLLAAFPQPEPRRRRGLFRRRPKGRS